MKKIIQLSDCYRLLSNGPLLIVVSRGTHEGHVRDNISTVAWSTPIDVNPALLAIIVDSAHLTWSNLLETRQCTLNIAGSANIRLASYAGSVSGRDRNKLGDTAALTVAGSVLPLPILPECLANIECRVLSLTEETGFVLLEPVSALADEEAFFAGWKMQGIYPVQHLGGERFQHGAEVIQCAPVHIWNAE
jgi:flavin reductase (DIM6/NTAB) family NADH-FMN oxidoreductase RutF